MKLSLLLFFTYLCHSEASFLLERAPLTKVYRWNDATIDTPRNKSIPDQVNLNVDVTVDTETYTMTISTRSSDSWLVSDLCKSRFCQFSKNKLPLSSKTDEKYIENYQVKGVLTLGTFSIYSGDTFTEFDLYGAVDVSYTVGKRLNSKHTNGILSLNRKPFSINASPQSLVALMTSGSKNIMGLFNYVPIDLLENTNALDNAIPAISFSKNSNEWTARIYYIRNTRGEWNTWCVGGCTAIFDTTYNGISGPANDIASINKYLGADENGMIDCDQVKTLEPLSFVINNQQYKLDAKNYIMQSLDRFESQCQTVFKVNDADNTGDNQWRLGLPFFDQHLTVIEYNGDDPSATAVHFLKLNKRLPKKL